LKYTGGWCSHPLTTVVDKLLLIYSFAERLINTMQMKGAENDADYCLSGNAFWEQWMHQSTCDHEILFAERSSKEEQLLMRSFL
jgi:hypothetical protein